MNRRSTAPLTAVAAAAAGGVLALSYAAAEVSSDGAQAVLTNVREVRTVQLVEESEDEFTMPDAEPGLTLTLRIELPAGKKLLSVGEPSSLTATDDAGRDLTERPSSMFGEDEFVEMAMSFENEPATEFMLHLGVSDRRARTFDLAAELEATAYEGTRQVEFTVGKEWAALDATWFSGRAVQVRLNEEGWFGGGIEFKPTSVEDVIEDLEVQVGEGFVTSDGWASDSETITYIIEDGLEAGVAVRLTVRTGLQSIPLRIDLSRQPLP